MNIDDIVYVSLLIISIGFGRFYRKIEDPNSRKNVGTLVGLLIVLVVSGVHIVHPLVAFFVNALIITNLSPKICHLVSFVVSFLYLFFFRTTIYFGLPYPPAHTNLVQMILTLKIVGLAFELNRSFIRNQNHNVKKSDLEEQENIKDTPSIIEMFHYCFNYVGVLTGPYYRYTTFRDSFELPFSTYADNWKFTLNKLKFVPMFIVLFLASSFTWPLSYALTDEFYQERSWLYRYWYIWPNFFTFRMRIYTGLVLSECACTMAGLGIYPEKCKPKSGEGPTENIAHIKEISKNKELLSKEEYNYDCIKNINPYETDFCVTYREGMKHWNICIQYWLAVNVYKRFPSKAFRTYATLMVSAVWHGVYTGYYACIGTVPFVLAIEDIWVKLLLKNESRQLSPMQIRIHKFVIWFFKMHFFSYQAIAMHLLELNKIFYYYNSIYHVGLILGIILYIIGLYLYKLEKKGMKSVNKKSIAGENVDGTAKIHSS
ncbi:lysophospholipid acyltransferase 7 [Harmonia axyridis]|uniref:lysophospholipid acyltransferase 7 n=1 Tax=Harmonia axyridis TaxID=115357 RepID=UPI001E277AC6|nr:lysophospholipid acyltransferase 7 [Harmonia axyridis]